MKKLLFLSLLLITTANFAQAQDPTKKSTKPVSVKGKDDNCMLNASYGTPLEINSHEKGKTKIDHSSNDFVQFNENGTYLESIKGVQSTGTWGYNYDTHEVSINCNGIRTYKVTLDSNGKIHLNGAEDKFKLSRKN
jgi:opacity protein-like surface antigen